MTTQETFDSRIPLPESCNLSVTGILRQISSSLAKVFS